LLYARAFAAAYTNAGGTDRSLAARLGVDEATVATWRRGEHRPQQDDVLYELLKLSDIEPAWTNRRKISPLPRHRPRRPPCDREGL